MELLNKLRSLPQVNHPDSTTLLDQMAAHAQLGLDSAEASKEEWPSRSAWLRAAYGLQRRADVWKAVLASQSLDPHRLTASSRPRKFEVTSLVREVRTASVVTGDEPGWNRFLLLNEIEHAAATPQFTKRQLVAQRFLSRLDSVRLTSDQKSWIANEPVQRLSAALRPWAAEPISVFALLEKVEHFEANPDDEGAAQLALAIQSLRHSQQPELVEVAAQLNDHYRNANLRVAITPSILERLLPDPPAKSTPVEQQILGASVRGQSVTRTRLGIHLLPRYEAWQIQLRANGDIQTNTVSRKGSATLTNSGSLDFQATTTIQVSTDGVRIDSPQVTVENYGNQLQSVASDFDTIPIVGPMVRAMIVSSYQSQRDRAETIARNAAEQEIGRNLDEEIRAAATKGEQQAMQRLFGPFAALNLNPLVIGLQTTAERLQVRYRVAGDYQLAANSPRPRAWSNSVCSLQVHQSTINNLLEQTLVAEEPLPLSEIWRRAVGPFGVDEPEGLPEQALLQFTPTRPVTMLFQQGLVELNLRIAALSLDDRLYRDFVVRVVYRPQVQGLTARLVREGTVSIQGQNLSTRDRLPIRVIFSKVFSEHGKPYLVHPSVAEDSRLADLTINQLETRDGWLAIALAPIATVPKVARLP
jgi:hypothetical protein